jgi:hypothetical protein
MGVEFEVLTAVFLKISVLWDIAPCSPLKNNRRFGGTCCLHLKNQGICQAGNQHGAGSKLGFFYDSEDGGDMFHRNAN